MYPAEFEYLTPSSLDEAIALLSKLPDARVLAGGQSLIPVLKLRLGAPGTLVDLRRLDELRYVREWNRGIEIGALVTYREAAVSPLLRGAGRAVCEAAAAVGDLQVRSRGTIGGALAHADPAGDVPAAVLAADGILIARGPAGSRSIPAAEFFLGPWTTALGPAEVVTAVRIPISPGSRGAYEKLEQKASGFALAGAAATLEMEADRVRAARVALTGVGPRPVLLEGTEALVGSRLEPAVVEATCRAGVDALDDPPGDLHASSGYRRAMAAVLARRVILRARA